LSVPPPLATAQQGDYLRIPVQVSLDLDPESGTIAPAADESALPLWVVITQTCDIRRDVDAEPYLHLAPVVPARSKKEWESAIDGRNSVRHFALPSLPDCEQPLLDIRLIQTVSKTAVLQGATELVAAPLSEATRARLREWLARRFGRVAFPSAIEDEILRPLRNRFEDALTKSSPDGALLRTREVFLVGYPGGTGAIEIVFVVDRNRASIDPQLRGDAKTMADAANTVMATISGRASRRSAYTLTWRVVASDDMRLSEYRGRYHELVIDS
jgi:hypothetical protein